MNIVLQSGNKIGDDREKQPKDSTWVCKAPVKEAEFDLGHAHETFMKERKIFAKVSTSGSNDKLDQEMDPSMLKTVLETCMKLLCDSKVVKGLQELK